MRYHYEKPSIYLSMYGTTYNCNHPIYNECTLFQIGEKGLAVIQQRFDPDTKATWWSWIDPWLTDDIYIYIQVSKRSSIFVLVRVKTGCIQLLRLDK